MTGKVVYTISKGSIIAKDNEFIGQKGAGNFLKRRTAKTIL